MLGPGNREGCACAPSPVEGTTEVSEGRVLNRVIRWTTQGWEMEPDQRHVDMIVQEMGMIEAKPVSTPGEPEQRWKRMKKSLENSGT